MNPIVVENYKGMSFDEKRGFIAGVWFRSRFKELFGPEGTILSVYTVRERVMISVSIPESREKDFKCLCKEVNQLMEFAES